MHDEPAPVLPLGLPDPTVVAPTLHRHEGPDTSVVASRRSAPAAATQRGHLLRLFHNAGTVGMTALEAERLMRHTFPRLRSVYPRLVELKDEGWVIVEERTRLTDSGSPAHVNVFNPEAEADYQAWWWKQQHKGGARG